MTFHWVKTVPMFEVCNFFSHIHISTKAWYHASYIKCIYKMSAIGTETLYSKRLFLLGLGGSRDRLAKNCYLSGEKTCSPPPVLFSIKFSVSDAAIESTVKSVKSSQGAIAL